MKRFFRVVGIILGVIVGLVAVAAGYLYFTARAKIDRRHAVPAVAAIAIPTDSASIAEGGRLARLMGCYGSCHGTTLEGGELINEPGLAHVVTPNVTDAVRRYSDPELVSILREGLRPDGKSVLIMPSEMIGLLSDEDLGRLIAFLRAHPQVQGPKTKFEIGPLGYLGLALGEFKTTRVLVEEMRALPAVELPDSLARGRNLALTYCSECHATSLQGDPAMKSPALGIVAGYTDHEFRRLMRTGEPSSGDSLKLMGPEARKRFVHLTDGEVEALYRYLRSLGTAPTVPGASSP